MDTTFAERLRWSRYLGPAARRAGKVIGANLLSREVGCAQSLISGLECNKAKSSTYSKAMADVLGVPRVWLIDGEGQAPEGFNAEKAREMMHWSKDHLLSEYHGAPGAHRRQGKPRWAAAAVAVTADSKKSGAEDGQSSCAPLQRSLMNDFMQFAELAGAKRATALIELMQHYARTSILSEESARKNET